MKEIEDSVAKRIASSIEGYNLLSGKKVSWASLAKAIGYTPQAPTNWKKGKISFAVLEKIAKYLGADPTWLMYGSAREFEIMFNMDIGKTILTNPHFNGYDAGFVIQDAETKALNESFKESIRKAYDPKKFGDFNKDPNEIVIPQGVTTSLEGGKQIPGARPVPIITFEQASDFQNAISNTECTYLLTYSDTLGDNVFVLVVDDESMSPEFRPGDRIVVDPQIAPVPGDYVVAQNGKHKPTFKKYRPREYAASGEVIFELAPINPDYPTMNSLDQSIRIIGVVIEHVRALRHRLN